MAVVKSGMSPGEKFMLRVRSSKHNAIERIFDVVMRDVVRPPRRGWHSMEEVAITRRCEFVGELCAEEAIADQHFVDGSQAIERQRGKAAANRVADDQRAGQHRGGGRHARGRAGRHESWHLHRRGRPAAVATGAAAAGHDPHGGPPGLVWRPGEHFRGTLA